MSQLFNYYLKKPWQRQEPLHEHLMLSFQPLYESQSYLVLRKVEILDFWMMQVKTYSLKARSYNQVIVVLLADNTLAISSMEGTVLFR